MKKISLFLLLLFSPHLFAAPVIDISAIKKPFYQFAFSLELNYFNPIGYYSEKMEKAPFLNLALVYNPRLLDNFLTFLETGYTGANVKYTDAQYSIIPLGAGVKYNVPFYRDIFLSSVFSSGFYFMNLDNTPYRNLYAKLAIGLGYSLTENLETGFKTEYLYLHDEYGGPKSLNFGINFQYAFGTPLAEKDVQILAFSSRNILSAQYPSYYKKQIGVLKIKNTAQKPLKNLQVSLKIPNYMDEKTNSPVKPILRPAETTLVPVYAYFNPQVLSIQEDIFTTGVLELSYEKADGKKYLKRDLVKVKIYSRNALLWDELSNLGSFITYKNPAILEFARRSAQFGAAERQENLPPQLLKALKIFEAARNSGINYISDPNSYRNLATEQVDYLQYPAETLSRKAGDCDDLSVLLASLLESVGIQTAFVSLPGHIFLLFEAQNLPDNDKLIVYQEKKWLPLETTLLREGFTTAWLEGYKNYLSAPQKDILLTRDALEENPPVDIKLSPSLSFPDKTLLQQSIQEEIVKLQKLFGQSETENPQTLDKETLLSKGINFCKAGLFEKCETYLKTALLKAPSYRFTYYNLIILYKKQKDYERALALYEQMQTVIPGDGKAAFLISKVYLLMKDFEKADTYYKLSLKNTPDNNLSPSENNGDKTAPKADNYGGGEEWVLP